MLDNVLFKELIVTKYNHCRINRSKASQDAVNNFIVPKYPISAVRLYIIQISF